MRLGNNGQMRILQVNPHTFRAVIFFVIQKYPKKLREKK